MYFTSNVTDYRQYLLSEHWRTTRAKQLRRHPVCAVCLSREQLEVHHIKYSDSNGSLLGREMPRHLRTLCRTCHGKIHWYGLEQWVVKLPVLDQNRLDIIKRAPAPDGYYKIPKNLRYEKPAQRPDRASRRAAKAQRYDDAMSWVSRFEKLRLRAHKVADHHFLFGGYLNIYPGSCKFYNQKTGEKGLYLNIGEIPEFQQLLATRDSPGGSSQQRGGR